MKKIICLILFLMFMTISIPAFAGYKIILKNGREFTVNDYKDVEGKIRFFIGGGEIEIDKDSIEAIKSVKTVVPEETSPAEAEPAKKDSPAETEAQQKETTPGDKSTDTGSKKQETDSRLKETTKKKREMLEEGKRLAEERKKLEEDIKREGRVTSIREKRDIQHRTTELEEKIKKYNEELGKIEDEQKMLIKEQEPKK